MTHRRNFLGLAGGLGLAAFREGSIDEAATAPGDDAARDIYELNRYEIASDAQLEGFDRFLRDAAIPAFNRIGLSPVGVFSPLTGHDALYVLLRHRSMESVLTSTSRLFADAEFVVRGAHFLDAPADKPAFQRVESSLLLAFKGMPALETPVKSPGRIFQLRIYESPSVKTGLKKIEMFNDAGEIAIFRRVGLHPVFFGQTIVGQRMPNLTYMLSFESEDELKANWAKFGADPDWQRLKGMAEYADKAILSHITNIVLKPAEYSQI